MQRSASRFSAVRLRYLKECHPEEFVKTLQWISEVILQRPELSVQVVVNWNGTENKM